MNRARAQVAIAIVGVAILAGSAPDAALAATRALQPAANEATASVSPGAPTQIVVFDRQAGTSTIVSHDGQRTPGSGSSRWPSVSADGSAVAFESDAALSSDDANGMSDVYLWSRATDIVSRVSQATGGGQADGPSRTPSIDGDGGLIAFGSNATNLVAGLSPSPNASQVYVAAVASSTISLASADPSGPATASSRSPSISRDGRVVAFESDAAGLVPGDTNDAPDVFLVDLHRNATIRASVDTGGRQAFTPSRRPAVDGNGGTVVFDSTSPSLVANDTNLARDVFVRDLPPAIQALPNPLDFGVVPLGTPLTSAVTVVSVGWTPVTFTASSIAGTNAGDYAIAGDTCVNQPVEYGSTCSIAVLDIPQASGPRTATLAIVDDARGSPQHVTLKGGVGPPQVFLSPGVGPPGIVVTVTGSGFPPAAVIVLRWDHGLSQSASLVVVGPDGRFVGHVLVFHNDVLGPRQLLVAAGPGGPAFDQLTAPFLVVPSTQEPPSTGVVSFLSPDLQLIPIRR